MRTRTEDSRKRSGQRSLVTVYLVVAVAVAGLVASRGFGARDAASFEATPEPAAPVKPMRLFHPGASTAQADLQTGGESHESRSVELAEATSSSLKVALTETKTTDLIASDKAAVSTESKFAAVAPKTLVAIADSIQKAAEPVADSEPELSLPLWSEKELLLDLAVKSVELDLHSGSPSLEEARAQVKSIAEEFAHFGARFDRRAEFIKRLRRVAGRKRTGGK